MKCSKSVFFILLLGFSTLSGVAAGCSDSSPNATEDAASESDSTQLTIQAYGSTNPLPSLTGVICEGDTVEPKPCEWSASADAIAWTEVHGIHAAPEWQPAFNDAAITNTCSQGVPALELKLEVKQLLRGDLPSDTISVRVGGGIAQHWYPLPYSDNDAVKWGVEVEAPEPLLKEGQILGVALHYDDTSGTWTTGGERLFTKRMDPETGEPVVVFQKTMSPNLCGLYFHQPSSFSNIAVKEFDETVATCDVTSQSRHRRDRVRDTFAAAERVYAGYCFDEPQNQERPECVSDGDCGEGLTCVDSFCTGG
jgi:hypothetical protein